MNRDLFFALEHRSLGGSQKQFTHAARQVSRISRNTHVPYAAPLVRLIAQKSRPSGEPRCTSVPERVELVVVQPPWKWLSCCRSCPSWSSLPSITGACFITP